MRSARELLLVIVLAGMAACAGPRLTGSTSTAHLPPPLVRRLDAPTVRPEAVAWPVLPAEGSTALCDT